MTDKISAIKLGVGDPAMISLPVVKYSEGKKIIEAGRKAAEKIIREYGMALRPAPTFSIPIDVLVDDKDLANEPHRVSYLTLKAEVVYVDKWGRAGVAIGWVVQKAPAQSADTDFPLYPACAPFIFYYPKENVMPVTKQNIFAFLCYAELLNYIEPDAVRLVSDAKRLWVRKGDDFSLWLDLVVDGKLVSKEKWHDFLSEVKSHTLYDKI